MHMHFQSCSPDEYMFLWAKVIDNSCYLKRFDNVSRGGSRNLGRGGHRKGVGAGGGCAPSVAKHGSF